MRRVAIIPARGGSVRIPMKNRKLFQGQPVICYPIAAARESGLFERIIVSTDTVEIADIAHDNGCSVHWRVEDDGSRGTQEVAKEVLEDEFVEHLDLWDAAAVIYATSPLLLGSDIQRAWRLLVEQHARYVMTVQAEPLADAGALYMGWRGAFTAGLPLIDIRTVFMPLPRERVCDVNTMEDWTRCEQLYAAMQQRNKEAA